MDKEGMEGIDRSCFHLLTYEIPDKSLSLTVVIGCITAAAAAELDAISYIHYAPLSGLSSRSHKVVQLRVWPRRCESGVPDEERGY